MLLPLLIASASWAGSPERPGFTPPSVHQSHAQRPPAGVPPAQVHPAPPSAGEPDIWVYGYLPYWVGGLDAVPWAHITHLAIFDVGLNSDGSLSSTSRWTNVAEEAVATAAAHGVKVHLTLTCFDDGVMAAVLGSSTLRTQVVEAVAALVNEAGAHGVSVDFEGMDIAQKAQLVSFVQELKTQVEEVTVATPAVDWGGAYDYDQLALASDALFIMGYGYHWSGGDPGPGAPLYGGGIWSKYSLEWSVDDHLSSGAPAGRLVLGLPLYGHEWPTTDTSVPGTATGSGEAVTLARAVLQAESSGRLYDTATETPYTFPSSRSQLWYEDNPSIEAKIAWAVDQGLLGVGFWALGYEALDPDFWARVDALSGAADPGEDTGDTDDTGAPVNEGLQARAGQDIVAWPGQTVIFSGRGSGAEDLEFAWTQVGGPTAALRGASSASARFTAEQLGTYVFELRVSDGATVSAPDALTVLVMEAPAGTCSTAPAAWSGWALLLFAAGLRRRR